MPFFCCNRNNNTNSPPGPGVSVATTSPIGGLELVDVIVKERNDGNDGNSKADKEVLIIVDDTYPGNNRNIMVSGHSPSSINRSNTPPMSSSKRRNARSMHAFAHINSAAHATQSLVGNNSNHSSNNTTPTNSIRGSNQHSPKLYSADDSYVQTSTNTLKQKIQTSPFLHSSTNTNASPSILLQKSPSPTHYSGISLQEYQNAQSSRFDKDRNIYTSSGCSIWEILHNPDIMKQSIDMTTISCTGLNSVILEEEENSSYSDNSDNSTNQNRIDTNDHTNNTSTHQEQNINHTSRILNHSYHRTNASNDNTTPPSNIDFLERSLSELTGTDDTDTDPNDNALSHRIEFSHEQDTDEDMEEDSDPDEDLHNYSLKDEDSESYSQTNTQFIKKTLKHSSRYPSTTLHNDSTLTIHNEDNANENVSIGQHPNELSNIYVLSQFAKDNNTHPRNIYPGDNDDIISHGIPGSAIFPFSVMSTKDSSPISTSSHIVKPITHENQRSNYNRSSNNLLLLSLPTLEITNHSSDENNNIVPTPLTGLIASDVHNVPELYAPSQNMNNHSHHSTNSSNNNNNNNNNQSMNYNNQSNPNLHTMAYSTHLSRTSSTASSKQQHRKKRLPRLSQFLSPNNINNNIIQGAIHPSLLNSMLPSTMHTSNNTILSPNNHHSHHQQHQHASLSNSKETTYATTSIYINGDDSDSDSSLISYAPSENTHVIRKIQRPMSSRRTATSRVRDTCLLQSHSNQLREYPDYEETGLSDSNRYTSSIHRYNTNHRRRSPARLLGDTDNTSMKDVDRLHEFTTTVRSSSRRNSTSLRMSITNDDVIHRTASSHSSNASNTNTNNNNNNNNTHIGGVGLVADHNPTYVRRMSSRNSARMPTPPHYATNVHESVSDNEVSPTQKFLDKPFTYENAQDL